jgi:hypothetical protein
MKKVMLSAAVAAMCLFAFAQNGNQNTAKTGAKKTAKKEMAKEKEHTCSAACKDGKHVFAHGEKGHTCTAECHKKM